MTRLRKFSAVQVSTTHRCGFTLRNCGCVRFKRPLFLSAVQLLWINIIMDSFAAPSHWLPIPLQKSLLIEKPAPKEPTASISEFSAEAGQYDLNQQFLSSNHPLFFTHEGG